MACLTDAVIRQLLNLFVASRRKVSVRSLESRAQTQNLSPGRQGNQVRDNEESLAGRRRGGDGGPCGQPAARRRDAGGVRVPAGRVERLGCFRVTGHGVPRELQAEMKAALRVLFDLPDDAKRRNADVITGSGYVAPSAVNPLYEALGIHDAAAPADVDAFCASLDAPTHVRETIRAYAEAMHGLIVDVAGKLASSLGLEGHSFQDWPCQFRMNRYNYNRDTVGSSGVQIHTDSGFLTVLQEDECVGGLEVLDPAVGEFVPIDPVAGSFLVNTGDVATAWSNGRLHGTNVLQAWSNGSPHGTNVKHRVQCVAPVPRISIAMFLLAPKDDRVCAPDAFVDADHPRRFREFSYDDYRRLRMSTDEHAGEALARLAV